MEAYTDQVWVCHHDANMCVVCKCVPLHWAFLCERFVERHASDQHGFDYLWSEFHLILYLDV